MGKCIAAVTNPGIDYPGYINFTRQDDGTVSVYLRGDPKKDDVILKRGDGVTLTLSAEAFDKLKAELSAQPV